MTGVLPSSVGDTQVVHTFDTERRDLKRRGYLLDLRMGGGRLMVVASRVGTDMTRRAQAQIDSSWAREILTGTMSPLSVLDRRLGLPRPPLVECVRMIVGGQRLHRVDSRAARAD